MFIRKKEEVVMTDIESKILNIIQTKFPLTAKPFKLIAEQIGVSEEHCLSVLKSLYERGILRTIRAVINWRNVGYSTILVGVCVDPDCIESVAAEINRYESVTHNYAREGERNLWFTLIYENDNEKNSLFEKIRNLHGVKDLKEFSAEKTYKIGLVLDV
jgi:DNA-binding Lrp family transcriptional regulator